MTETVAGTSMSTLMSAFDAFGSEAKGETAEEVLKNAGMDFEVELQPIFRNKNGGAVKDNSRFRRVARTDTEATLGVVSTGFVPYQPAEMAALAESMTSGKGVLWDRVGVTHGGARMLMSFQLPDSFTFGEGETMASYFYLMNAHDGSSGMKIVPSPVRLACSNQFPMLDSFLRENGINPKELSIRHSSQMHNRLDELIPKLKIIDTLVENFAQANADLLEVEMDIGARTEYYIDVLGLKTDTELIDLIDNPEGLATRGKNTLAALMEVEGLARNNIGEMNNTANQAFNVITDFIDHRGIHDIRGAVSQRRVESAIIGSSARKKNEAWSKLQDRVAEARGGEMEVRQVA